MEDGINEHRTQLTSNRRLDTSSVMRCPVAASSSSICAVRMCGVSVTFTTPEQALNHWTDLAPYRGVCQVPQWLLPNTAAGRPSKCSAAVRAAHLDLAVALGQQPVADPVLWRKVAGAAPRGVLLAQHALRAVAAVVPARQVRRSCEPR